MSKPTISQQYNRLLKLEPNWDSYGAKRINKRAARMAEKIHRGLLIHLDEIAIVPCSDGGVQLETRNDGLDIEIQISPVPTGQPGASE